MASIATMVSTENAVKIAWLQWAAKKPRVRKAGMGGYFKPKEDILSHILIKHTYDFINTLKYCSQES